MHWEKVGFWFKVVLNVFFIITNLALMHRSAFDDFFDLDKISRSAEDGFWGQFQRIG